MKFIRAISCRSGWGGTGTERRRLGAVHGRCVLTHERALCHGTHAQRRDDAVSGSQGWYVDEPSGEPTNFGIQQVDSNVTDPPRRAAASLQQVVEGAADHVRAARPLHDTRPGERASRRAFGRHLPPTARRGYPVSLQIARLL